MTFEKALEAMKQGKKVRCPTWCNKDEYICFAVNGEDNCIVDETGDYSEITLNEVFDLDWEIYEEPQEEPEMTAEKALEIIKCLLDYNNAGFNDDFCYNCHFKKANVSKALEFVIEAIENQENYIRETAFNKFSDGMQHAFNIVEEMKAEDDASAIDSLFKLDRYLEVGRLSCDGKFFVRYENAEVKEEDFLIGVVGRGETFHQACKDYLDKIRGKTIVFDATTKYREEVTVL